MVDLTLPATFYLLFFLPPFTVTASNMQGTPINDVGRDTVFSGCDVILRITMTLKTLPLLGLLFYHN